MGYLADSLLMIVDCSGIEGQMREDLFMNSRDRLRETKLSQRLEQELERSIKEEPTLRALRNSRRAQELADKLADSKPLTNVLEDLLRRSPTLAKLFLQGVKLSSPFPSSMGAGEGGSGEFKGKTYPTYFRFRGMSSGEDLQRDSHLGSSVRLAFETDGADDYFVRDLDPGKTDLWETRDKSRIPAANWVMRGPRSGIANLSFELPDDLDVGDMISFEIEVTDPSRVEPFLNRIRLVVRPPNKGGDGGGGPSPSATHGRGNKGGGSQLALPNVAEIREEQWEEYDFNANTALVVKHAGQSDGEATDVYDFFVNIDNKFLRIAQKESKEDPKLIRAKFVYSEVLIGLALLQDNSGVGEDGTEAEGPGVESVVARTTSALAPIVLPILETIGALSVDEED